MRKPKLRLLWVGKTKEPYLRQAIEDYAGRIARYAEVELVEIKEEKGDSAGISPEGLKREGRRITERATGYTLLDERGRALSSTGLADFLRDRASADFVIGGAYGVSDEVKAAARDTLCLSQMTLTHEMARVLLLEQLYRAFTIIRGTGYHH